MVSVAIIFIIIEQNKIGVLFICLLLKGRSALFRPLVPIIVEVEHTIHVKNDLK